MSRLTTLALRAGDFCSDLLPILSNQGGCAVGQDHRRAEALRAALTERPAGEPLLHSVRVGLEEAISAEDTDLLRRWIAINQATPGVLRTVLGGNLLKINQSMAEFFALGSASHQTRWCRRYSASAVGAVVQTAQRLWFTHGGSLTTAISESLEVLDSGVGVNPWAAIASGSVLGVPE